MFLAQALPLTELAGTELSSPVRIAILLTLLSLVPGLLIAMTSFIRIIVVLAFMRRGLGLGQAPPTPVLIGLGLFLTFFTMAPVGNEVKKVALEPYQRGEMSWEQAVAEGITPLKQFMLSHVRERDLSLFVESETIATAIDIPLKSLAPAFVISELTTAFTMGFMILIPFLVIDLAVAASLMAMGMIVLPPPTVSLPIKILVFVVADGWYLLVGSLLESYGIGGGGLP